MKNVVKSLSILNGNQTGINILATFSLRYVRPFDWQSLLSFYRAHQIFGVETITDEGYGRVFKIGQSIGSLWITHPNSGESALTLDVTIDDPVIRSTVEAKIRRMFDLDLDPPLVSKAFRSQHYLADLWSRYRGLRLVKGWDPFEVAINTILGQVVSVSRAKAMMKQLVEHYGEAIRHPFIGEGASLFPKPERLADASLDEIGTTQTRKNTIRTLARLIVDGKIDFTLAQDIKKLTDSLLAVPGIGPWSADYIALRGFGYTDAFPDEDLALKRAMQQHPEVNLEAVRPWRSYAAVCLWKDYTNALPTAKGVTQ